MQPAARGWERRRYNFSEIAGQIVGSRVNGTERVGRRAIRS